LFYKKEWWLSKTYPEGTFIQILAELSNGNLVGIENGNNIGEAEVLKAPQCLSKQKPS
jgi:hypothetical protein